MNIVLLTHPEFAGFRSQDRFADMLLQAYKARGHRVELRRPIARVRRAAPARWAKWAGYVDQYLLFPRALRQAARQDPRETLYVFCDQALGPWMPALTDRPHVVHCHDLLALGSALGEWPENPPSATGWIYQRYIRRGMRSARHFISISHRTREDLHRLAGVTPRISEVVYNGLTHPFRRQPAERATSVLREAGLPSPPATGFILHVSGAQWYKNPAGVLGIYGELARSAACRATTAPELWMVCPPPDGRLCAAMARLPAGANVRFFQNISSEALEALYSLARAMLFPSLAEGFGWPIAEALSCDCPVLTTEEAPMTEVGGAHVHYLPRLRGGDDLPRWAALGARLLESVIERPAPQRQAAAQAAQEWVGRFNADRAIEAYLAIYRRILEGR